MQSECFSEDPGRRQQYEQLSRYGYDQAVDAVAECLKDGAEDDAEACEQVAPADDAQCVRADRDHIFRSVEEQQQLVWNELEYDESEHHHHKCKCAA